MAITSSTTTAFDVPKLVSQLMAVERRPIDQLQTRVSSHEAKISSWGTLSGLVSTFQSATKTLGGALEKLAATSSDTGAFTASAASNAVPGSYSVSVNKLAQAQNLVAAGQASSSTAIGDGSATTLTFEFGTISGGTLTDGIYSGASFTANGSGPASITIDSSNNTLEGIRDAINAANLGVTATLVNDGSTTPYRLALTSTSTGETQSMRISTSGGDGSIGALLNYDPAGTQNLSQTQAAQNAALKVNGIAITSATNTVSDAIQGVTLSLKNTTAAPATLAVARDTAAITAAATSFVDAYNAMASQMKSRFAYGSKTTAAGALAGDGTLRTMQEQLRGIFNTPATGGTLTALAQVGISMQKDGSLALDSGKLTNALATNHSDVVNLFNSPSGFATRFDAWAKETVNPGGLIDTRTTNLKSNVSNFNTEIDRLENRMAALERKYTKEYTNLNMLLSSMNTTSTYLTQQLSGSSTK